MKPFNLERALAGDPVVTRQGGDVLQLTKFHTANGQNLFGVLNGAVHSWYPDGCYMANLTHKMDLFMAPKKRTVWVNLYSQDYKDSRCSFGGAHGTEQGADEMAEGTERVGGKAWPLEIEE